MKLFILCLCFTSSLCGKNYKENKLWGQPCNDDNSVPSPSKSAEEVVRYTTWILEQLDSYKDEFVQKLEKRHETFEELVQFAEHDKEEWLRKFYWFTDEILPSNKLLGQPLPKNTIENVKSKIKLKEFAMTKINAGLKFIVGTIDEITKLPINAEIMNIDLKFRRTIRESIRIIRSIMCSMGNYMKSKKYLIEVLLDDFLQKNITHHEVGLMLRDTFNYFEYIKQLFEILLVNEYAETATPNESNLWANPCHYSPPPSYYFNKSLNQNDWKPDPEKAKELAKRIASQATKTFEDGKIFMDTYAQTLSNYPTFDEELDETRDDEWLRKVGWYQDEVLPESKQLFSEIPYNYLTKHLMKVFPKVLPLIHKGAKKILSGLNRVINLKLLKKTVYLNFKPVLEAYMLEVQNLLCLLSDFLKARGQEQLWLFEETRISPRWIFPIFRDSLNYLEYIAEVFEYIAINEGLGLDPYNPQ